MIIRRLSVVVAHFKNKRVIYQYKLFKNQFENDIHVVSDNGLFFLNGLYRRRTCSILLDFSWLKDALYQLFFCSIVLIGKAHYEEAYERRG
jgi:hypothetical protein